MPREALKACQPARFNDADVGFGSKAAVWAAISEPSSMTGIRQQADPQCKGGPALPLTSAVSARPVLYLASIAVTSTSIAILGHANWLTTRNVEAGIGAPPKASARHFSAS